MRRLRTKPITRFAVSLGVWCTPSKALPELRFLPFKCCFPAGLSRWLVWLGAGLVGAGVAGATLYGLDRARLPVSLIVAGERIGLGVDYGAPTAFDLNFARFGAGGRLRAVAAGAYDVTIPAFLGLLSSGAGAGQRLKRRLSSLAQHSEDSRGIF